MEFIVRKVSLIDTVEPLEGKFLIPPTRPPPPAELTDFGVLCGVDFQNALSMEVARAAANAAAAALR